MPFLAWPVRSVFITPAWKLRKGRWCFFLSADSPSLVPKNGVHYCCTTDRTAILCRVQSRFFSVPPLDLLLTPRAHSLNMPQICTHTAVVGWCVRWLFFYFWVSSLNGNCISDLTKSATWRRAHQRAGCHDPTAPSRLRSILTQRYPLSSVRRQQVQLVRQTTQLLRLSQGEIQHHRRGPRHQVVGIQGVFFGCTCTTAVVFLKL